MTNSVKKFEFQWIIVTLKSPELLQIFSKSAFISYLFYRQIKSKIVGAGRVILFPKYEIYYGRKVC